jgi:PKD repeat protein
MKRAVQLLAMLCVLAFAAGAAWANAPPIAEAGPDQEVYFTDATVLRGSATDPDRDPIVAWSWTLESMPEGSWPVFPDPHLPVAYFEPDKVGDYVFSLVVSDGTNWSAPDTVTVHVVLNLPPVAVMSAHPTSGEVPLTVQFDSTGSYDPEGGPITYAWMFGDFEQSLEPSPTHTYVEEGTYGVQLLLVDDRNQYDIAIVYIEVLPPSVPSQTGPVIGWGCDFPGQCNPRADPGDVVAIAAGGGHSLALRSDGQVIAWGCANYGQYNIPPLPAGLSYTAISAGRFHSLALRSDGQTVAWGQNWYGQSDVPVAARSGVVAIAAGDEHSLALKSDGTVVGWGADTYYSGVYRGQATPPAGLAGVVAIAAGGYHSLALKSDGTVVAWGYNGYGQCNVPADLSGVIAIAAGGYHSLALKSDGTVVGWGDNYFGQCNVPAQAQSGVVAIAAGGYHSLALKSDGTVVAWGYNGYGQCNVPADLSGVIAIAAGRQHSLALLTANQPPVADAGPGQVLEATGGTTSFTLDATGSSDPDGDVLTYAWSDADGNAVGSEATVSVARALGSHTFTLTVTDPGAMHSSDSVSITIQDTTPPTLSLPADMVVEATSAAGAVVEFDVTASDLAGGPLQVTCTPGSGLVFGLGVTTVNCTATDSSGNTAYGSFTVTVVDTTPPVLSLPADLVLEPTSPQGAVGTFSASATDLVDGAVPVTCAPASGSVFPLGSTTMQASATDAHGNTADGSFTVTVRDTTPPALTPPADMQVAEGDPNGTTVALGQPTVSDMCDPSPVVTNNAPAKFPLGATTVTWTATDASGNVATAQQRVTVVPGSLANQLANLRKFIVLRVASGQIAAELESSLLAKVDAAIAAPARGNPNDAKAAMGGLKALVNQVEAQTDNKIDPATAAEIIRRANQVIAALGG